MRYGIIEPALEKQSNKLRLISRVRCIVSICYETHPFKPCLNTSYSYVLPLGIIMNNNVFVELVRGLNWYEECTGMKNGLIQRMNWYGRLVLRMDWYENCTVTETGSKNGLVIATHERHNQVLLLPAPNNHFITIRMYYHPPATGIG